MPVNKRISASLSRVSRLFYLFANRQRVRHHQRQLPRLRRGIDQNVYTYARFSFNNSSNALSAHKKLWHSTFVFGCVCKMCEVSGRGGVGGGAKKQGKGKGMCKLWQCRQHPHRHLQIRPDHLCVASSDGISIIGKTAWVCVWAFTYACVCVGACVLSFKIFILLCALAGPHWRLNTITQIEFTGSSSSSSSSLPHYLHVLTLERGVVGLKGGNWLKLCRHARTQIYEQHCVCLGANC